MIADDEARRLLRAAMNFSIRLSSGLPKGMTPDEVAQEAWVRLLRAMKSNALATETERLAYLLGIVHRTSIDAWRTHARRISLSHTGYIGDAASGRRESAAPASTCAEIEALARACLHGLPTNDIDLFLVVTLHGSSWREARLASGVPNKHLDSARKRIRRFLSDPSVHKRFLDALGLDAPPQSKLNNRECW